MPSSYHLTPKARNRTQSGYNARQIAQSLQRNGDFSYFPIGKRRSVARYCDYEGLEVRIKQVSGKGYVERIGSIFDKEQGIRSAGDALSDIHFMQDRIAGLELVCIRLSKLLTQGMGYSDNGDWLARCMIALEDYEDYLNKN